MLETIKKISMAFSMIFILTTSIYFNKKLKIPGINIEKIAKSLKHTNSKISPIKTLYLSLASRIGVGSISGVALAIFIAGPGTIFWMWIFTILSSSLSFIETYYAIKYKNKTKGGPSYYIEKALKNKPLALLYSAIIILTYLIGIIPIQTNTIAKTVSINSLIVGLIIFITVYLSIKKGTNKILKITNKVVPLMTIIYLLLEIIVIMANINKIPTIIKLIITSAFNTKSFILSFLPTIITGFQRGIFSNESGLGLGAITATLTTENNPTKSAYVNILGTYITTFIICTSTAIIILLAIPLNITGQINGIELTSMAFTYHFGSKGKTILTIVIILFAYSTILAAYYYINTSLKYILKKQVKIITILIPFSAFLGALISPNIIWDIVDIMISYLAIINTYSLYKIYKKHFTNK